MFVTEQRIRIQQPPEIVVCHQSTKTIATEQGHKPTETGDMTDYDFV